LTYEINHASVISRAEIEEFLDYYDGLKRDSDDTDYTDEDRAAYLDEYEDYDQELVTQLRQMHEYTRYGDDFISESHWEDYTREYADECVLHGADEVIIDHFDYEKWADTMSRDYTEWSYDGVSYYSRD
jgi:sulfur relay (sulfurtransferase) DsrC/TusE family protein